MKILMLLGGHKTGKTSAINSVFNAIKNPHNQSTSLSHSNNSTDFEAITTYKGLKVGFYSAGDSHEDIVYAITHYYHTGCDVLICANSFKGSLFANGWLTKFSPLHAFSLTYILIKSYKNIQNIINQI